MSDSVCLSVALVTRNRPVSLRRTLQSLAAQRPQAFEVTVSDDSDDAYAEVVEDLVRSFGHQYVRGPRRGLYANRNHLIRSCRGTHIRTMDDDHEFPAGHIAACLAAIENDPAAVWIIGEFVGGEVEGRGVPPCPGQLTPRGFSSSPPDPDHCWAIADGATIYPRSLFDQGHVFCEDFKFGASYLEFGSLLYSLGYRIRFLDDTYILHHYMEENRSFMDKDLQTAARAFAALCHSFIYQPTAYNRFITAAELGTRWFRTGCRTAPFWQAAISFRRRLLEHRREILSRRGRQRSLAEQPPGIASGAEEALD